MKVEIILNIILNVLITVIGAFITYGLAIRQGKKEIYFSELRQRRLDNWNRELNQLEKEKEELIKLNMKVNEICDREPFYRNKVLLYVKILQNNISELDKYEIELFDMFYNLNKKLMEFVLIVEIRKYDVIENKNKLMELYSNLHKESMSYHERFTQFCELLRVNEKAEFEVPKRISDKILNDVMFLMKRMIGEVDKKIEYVKSQKPK